VEQIVCGEVQGVVAAGKTKYPAFTAIAEADGSTSLQVTQAPGSGANAVQPNSYAVIAASKATNTVISANPGRIFRVIVTTVGANPMAFYDNATTNTGNIVAQLAASAPLGVYDFNVPVGAGITSAGSATNPGVTVTFA
jgi:hypothetical protein